MQASSVPPRRVKIGDAAAFVGITPRAIRHYHELGLLPEPERGADGRRRYGYEDMIRLLWIRRMAEAGIALDDIRDAFTKAPSTDTDRDVVAILERLETALVAREAEVQRQLTLVQRMRDQGTQMGLLSEVVSSRLTDLPDGSLRSTDLDALLVTERIFGPLGAAVQASRFIALASDPALREKSDRVEAAEDALDDDTISVDDPRVAQAAAARHTFELALSAAVDDSGVAESENALFESWDSLNHALTEGSGQGTHGGQRAMRAVQAVGRLSHDFSPARLRCMELAEEAANGASRTGP